MVELLEKLWSQYPLPSLIALGIFDFALFYYVIKSLKNLSSGNSKKSPKSEQRQLLDAIKSCAVEAEKTVLINEYNQKYGAADLKALTARKAKTRIQAIRRLSLLGELHLYEIKKMIDDKDDGVSLRAFRIITRMSDITNLALLEKAMARAAKHRTLFASCLMGIASSSNHQVLIELIKTELPPWVAIACMKALNKAQAGDLLPMLLNAQDNGSAEIRRVANEILNKNPNFQKFAS
jgi:HEAT repeat protein